jgi:hypothetical protein
VAIRYATGRREPKEDIAEEFLSDAYWPICSPQLLPPSARLRSAADLQKYLLAVGRRASGAARLRSGRSARSADDVRVDLVLTL